MYELRDNSYWSEFEPRTSGEAVDSETSPVTWQLLLGNPLYMELLPPHIIDQSIDREFQS
jgi:hypothetical protein